jgi:RNA polymerase sigma-54 factor
MAGIGNTLQLRQTQRQSMVLTPQMQQAIKLLQLSTLDLRQEIEQAVEQNPMLEIAEDTAADNFESYESLSEREQQSDSQDDFNPFDDDASVKSADSALSGNGSDGALSFDQDTRALSPEAQRADEEHEIRQEITADRENGDQTGTSDDSYSASGSERNSLSVRRGSVLSGSDTVYEGETIETLQDHLREQLDCSPLQGADYRIAEYIIDGIDESGYFREPLAEIAALVAREYPGTDADDVTSVLKLVQHYDPLGIASRGPQEYIRIQLGEKPQSPARDLALKMTGDYFEQLLKHDYRTLCSRLGVKEPQLKAAYDLIQTLNPRPGTFTSREKAQFVIPDVLVEKKDGRYVARLNPDCLPKVQLNEQYRRLAASATSERDRKFFSASLSDANSFLSSIEKRNETLIKVASFIVESQQDFMEYGPGALHPMVLNDVAVAVERHESTVSRITTSKYMHTPQGTFELKYFFSSKVSTDDGGSASATAIQTRIRELISGENPRKPLSDSKIADLLSKEGFMVARRTVAKYRELLQILPSSQRKRLV